MRTGALAVLRLAGRGGPPGCGPKPEDGGSRGRRLGGPSEGVDRGAQEVHGRRGTYGYTSWRPESGASRGEPVARVALAYDLEPREMEKLAFEGVPARRETVSVGKKKLEGVSPVPGSTPSTEVYVPVRR